MIWGSVALHFGFYGLGLVESLAPWWCYGPSPCFDQLIDNSTIKIKTYLIQTTGRPVITPASRQILNTSPVLFDCSTVLSQMTLMIKLVSSKT